MVMFQICLGLSTTFTAAMGSALWPVIVACTTYGCASDQVTCENNRNTCSTYGRASDQVTCKSNRNCTRCYHRLAIPPPGTCLLKTVRRRKLSRLAVSLPLLTFDTEFEKEINSWAEANVDASEREDSGLEGLQERLHKEGRSKEVCSLT